MLCSRIHQDQHHLQLNNEGVYHKEIFPIFLTIMEIFQYKIKIISKDRMKECIVIVHLLMDNRKIKSDI